MNNQPTLATAFWRKEAVELRVEVKKVMVRLKNNLATRYEGERDNVGSVFFGSMRPAARIGLFWLQSGKLNDKQNGKLNGKQSDQQRGERIRLNPFEPFQRTPGTFCGTQFFVETLR